MLVKVLHVAFSDGLHGADRAAYRIHHSLRSIGVQSHMLVQKGVTDDPTVHVIEQMFSRSRSWNQRKSHLVRWFLKKGPKWLVGADKTTQKSLALFPSVIPDFIQASGYTVVHLHWVNREMMSLGDIERIQLPLLWSCHDQWPFLGLRHYQACAGALDRWMLSRKRALFAKKRIALLCPTEWMADRARQSGLPIVACDVVRLPLDTAKWRRGTVLWPESPDVPTIAFGAVGGGRDPRKGFDLFVESLHYLKRRGVKVRVILFGDAAANYGSDLPMPTVCLGELDDTELKAVYSSVQLLCVCSRIDNSPMMVLEAMACETPVVAFSVGGVSELIVDGVTGYLVEPGNAHVFAASILRALERRQAETGKRARRYIETAHHPEQTARQLLAHYQSQISGSCH